MVWHDLHHLLYWSSTAELQEGALQRCGVLGRKWKKTRKKSMLLLKMRSSVSKHTMYTHVFCCKMLHPWFQLGFLSTVIYSKEHNSHITTQFPYNHSKSCFQPISHTVITTEAQWSWMISRTSLKSHKKHSWISDDVDSSHSPRTCTCRVLHITPGYKGAAASIKRKKKFLPIPIGIHSIKPSEQEMSSASPPAGAGECRLTGDLRTWSATSKESPRIPIPILEPHGGWPQL